MKNKCYKCGKKIHSSKAYEAPYEFHFPPEARYCQQCYIEELQEYLDCTIAQLRQSSEKISILKKRLKNKGTRVWVVFEQVSKREVISGIISRRTQEECGIKFTDERVLNFYDTPDDSILLWYKWQDVYLSETEAEYALASKTEPKQQGENHG